MVVVVRHPRWQRRKSIRSPSYSPLSGDDDDNPSTDDQSTCAPVWRVGTWAITLLGSLLLPGLSIVRFFRLLDGFCVGCVCAESTAGAYPMLRSFSVTTHPLHTSLFHIDRPCALFVLQHFCPHPTSIFIIFQMVAAAITRAPPPLFCVDPKF
jgi:hypothetical protein